MIENEAVMMGGRVSRRCSSACLKSWQSPKVSYYAQNLDGGEVITSAARSNSSFDFVSAAFSRSDRDIFFDWLLTLSVYLSQSSLLFSRFLIVFRMGWIYSFASVAGLMTRDSIILTSSVRSAFSSMYAIASFDVRSICRWAVGTGSCPCPSDAPTIGLYSSSNAAACACCDAKIVIQDSCHDFDASISYIRP